MENCNHRSAAARAKGRKRNFLQSAIEAPCRRDLRTDRLMEFIRSRMGMLAWGWLGTGQVLPVPVAASWAKRRACSRQGEMTPVPLCLGGPAAPGVCGGRPGFTGSDGELSVWRHSERSATVPWVRDAEPAVLALIPS